jgi:type I restriction enzyme, S subunit
MTDEWPVLTIDQLKARRHGAISIGPFGSRMRADRYVVKGVPVIRGINISDTRVLGGDFAFVSEKTADELRSSNVFAEDLVFPHRGAIGRVGIVPNDGVGRYMLSTSLMKLSCNRELVEPFFLFYFFRSELGRGALLRNASTVGTPGIGQPLASLRSISLRVPPLPQQRRIIEILGRLDDKIELNRRMNETLETMARTIFKAWFVDFAPVRAKAEARDPGLPEPLADIFPDRFYYSELGEIPAGWSIQAFSDTVDIIGGGTPKTSVAEYWNGDVPWFSVVDAPSTSDVWVVETERKISHLGVANSSTNVLPVGTTIISARGTVGQVALVGVPMAMNQSCYGLAGTVGAESFFTYYRTRDLVSILRQRAHGSVFDTITRDTLAGIRVVAPPGDLLEAFENQVSPVLRRVRTALNETRSLANLRDILLPKLISGELRVPQAERMLEATPG